MSDFAVFPKIMIKWTLYLRLNAKTYLWVFPYIVFNRSPCTVHVRLITYLYF